jgi:glycosyltransferase involved in cell wall biosynthesis
MSFIVNVMENDTLKYWKNRLKYKWFRWPFLVSKNVEIEAFLSEHVKPKEITYDGPTSFEISSKINTINISSTIAIVVPIYVNSKRSQKQVERLIKSIKSQDRETKHVFLIDDCSPFGYDNLGYHVYKMEKNGGPAKARNFGIELAKKVNADIIAFTDSDVILPSNWLSSIIDTFIENRFMQAISGKTKSYGKTWYDMYHNINGTLNGRKFKNSKQLLYGPTCNFAIINRELGDQRFNTDFPLAAGEDIEFCFKFLDKGNNIGYGEKVVVYHDFGFTPLSVVNNKRKFVNVFKKYARGEEILLIKVPQYYYFLNNTIEISNAISFTY